jgi:hypothetical protein
MQREVAIHLGAGWIRIALGRSDRGKVLEAGEFGRISVNLLLQFRPWQLIWMCVYVTRIESA